MFELDILTQLLGQVELHSEMGLVTAALMVIGFGLKQTPRMANWAIVWVLLFIGTVAGLFVVGQSTEGVINGILSAGSAIAAHQVIKQTKNRA